MTPKPTLRSTKQEKAVTTTAPVATPTLRRRRLPDGGLAAPGTVAQNIKRAAAKKKIRWFSFLQGELKNVDVAKLEGMEQTTENLLTLIDKIIGPTCIVVTMAGVGVTLVGALATIGGVGFLTLSVGLSVTTFGFASILFASAARHFISTRNNDAGNELFFRQCAEKEAAELRERETQKHLPTLLPSHAPIPLPEPITSDTPAPAESELAAFLRELEKKEESRKALDGVLISDSQRAELDELTGEEARAALRKLIALVRAQGGPKTP